MCSKNKFYWYRPEVCSEIGIIIYAPFRAYLGRQRCVGPRNYDQVVSASALENGRMNNQCQTFL